MIEFFGLLIVVIVVGFFMALGFAGLGIAALALAWVVAIPAKFLATFLGKFLTPPSE